MKARLEFDLSDDDDKVNFLLAQRGNAYYCMLNEIENMIRSKVKYGEFGEETTKVLEDMYREFFDITEGYSIDIP